MIPEEVLSQRAHVLSQAQREFYFDHGYLCVENCIDDDWLKRLHVVTDDFVERSRTITESDEVFDIASSHSPSEPKLRRLKEPDAQHVRIGNLQMTSLRMLRLILWGLMFRFITRS